MHAELLVISNILSKSTRLGMFNKFKNIPSLVLLLSFFSNMSECWHIVSRFHTGLSQLQ